MKKIKRLATYFAVWKIFGFNAMQTTFVNRGSNLLFMIGKVIRLTMSLVFLYLIRENITNFAGYTVDQMIVFFLTYQFIDLLSQVFYRGVYMFGNLIRKGNFDFLLSKPINPLFRALTGRPDINDAIFIVPTTLISLYILTNLEITITLQSALLYAVLLVNSFLIATALHILVLVVGVLTTEVDGIIWIYRDLNHLSRFPVGIYMEPFRFALFFIIPIGMMVTIPTEILLGLRPTYSIFLATGVGIGSFLVSLKLWNWALKKYSSASS